MMQSLGGDDFNFSREDVELLNQLYYYASNGSNEKFGYARYKGELHFREGPHEVVVWFNDSNTVLGVQLTDPKVTDTTAEDVVQKALAKLKRNSDFTHALAAKAYKIVPYRFHELWKNRGFFQQRSALSRGMPYYFTDWYVGALNSHTPDVKWAQIYLSLDERAEKVSDDNPSFSYCYYFGSEPGSDHGVFVRMRVGGAGDYRALAECDPKWYKVAHDLFDARYEQIRLVMAAGHTL